MNATVSTPSMAERGRAYTELVEAVSRRGEGALHASEREMLFDAADALLFSEEEAETKKHQAEDMILSLREAGRWTESASQEIFEILGRIGG